MFVLDVLLLFVFFSSDLGGSGFVTLAHDLTPAISGFGVRDPNSLSTLEGLGSQLQHDLGVGLGFALRKSQGATFGMKINTHPNRFRSLSDSEDRFRLGLVLYRNGSESYFEIPSPIGMGKIFWGSSEPITIRF